MNYWEQQYNPRLGCENAPQYFDDWSRRAVAARKSLAGEIDLSYGPHPRERLDLFHAATPRGTLIFLHGGYWRAFDKSDFTWIAPHFVGAGISVAIPSYPHCPAVSLSAIVRSVTKALNFLDETLLTEAERRVVVIVGHSAGAHLAACQSSFQSGLLRRVPEAIVGISGVFDLTPLLHTDFLLAMNWSAEELHSMSPLFAPPAINSRFMLAVGSAESSEFHLQSLRLAEAWGPLRERPILIDDANHFTALNCVCEPEHSLGRAVLNLF